MTNLRKAGLTLTIFVLTSAPMVLAQGTYTQIDYPGAIYTVASAINASGIVVGYYQDTATGFHGFLLSDGVYTSVDYGNAADTFFYGVNDSGKVVGRGYPGIAFIYDIQTEAFKDFRVGVPFNTTPFAINNSSIVVGYAAHQVHSTDYIVGFEFFGGKAKHIAVPNESLTAPKGITSSGIVVGFSSTAAYVYTNFRFKDGKYQQLTIPNAPDAIVLGTNPAGSTLVGTYEPSSGTFAGFAYQNDALTMLQFPGGRDTSANGVNDAGIVVGQFQDPTTNATHGFTWTPPADAEKK